MPHPIQKDSSITKFTRAIILAAGKGSRMHAKEIPKVMHGVLGKPMIRYVVDALTQIGITDIIVVIGYQRQVIQDYLKDQVQYAIQEELLGTAHAVKTALQCVEEKKDTFVLVGDAPGIPSALLLKMIEQQHATQADLVFVAGNFDFPLPYGRVIRDTQGNVRTIIEENMATAEQKLIRELFTSQYFFKKGQLESYVPLISPSGPKHEENLTDIIALMVQEGCSIETVQAYDPISVMGANSREDLEKLKFFMKHYTGK